MSVNELQALTQQFADAFDRRDLKTFLGMLSDDVEVFDHVLDLPPKVRQVVKTQNPLNGRIESWDCLAGSSPRSSSWPR